MDSQIIYQIKNTFLTQITHSRTLLQILNFFNLTETPEIAIIDNTPFNHFIYRQISNYNSELAQMNQKFFSDLMKLITNRISTNSVNGDSEARISSIKQDVSKILSAGKQRYLDSIKLAYSFDMEDQRQLLERVNHFIEQLFNKNVNFGTKFQAKKISIKRNFERFKQMNKKSKRVKNGLSKDVQSLMLGLDLRTVEKGCQIGGGDSPKIGGGSRNRADWRGHGTHLEDGNQNSTRSRKANEFTKLDLKKKKASQLKEARPKSKWKRRSLENHKRERNPYRVNDTDSDFPSDAFPDDNEVLGDSNFGASEDDWFESDDGFLKDIRGVSGEGVNNIN